MFVTEYIQANNPSKFEEMLRKHSVKNLYVFGSSLESDNPKDIDLIIEVDEDDPLVKGEALLDLWDFFEIYFDRGVDLLTSEQLKNPYLKEEINQTKQLIYAHQNQPSLLV